MEKVNYSKITKRADGRYQAYAAYKNGKRKYVYAATKQECRAKLAELIEQLNHGILSSDMLLADLTESYLDNKKDTVSPSTYREYVRLIAGYVCPRLGATVVSDITQATIQSFVSAYQRNHSEKSTKNLLGLVHSIFDYARRNKLIYENPAEYIRITASAPYRYYIYSSEEVEQLLELASKKGNFAIPIYLAALCGLRMSECMGLRWEDINWEKGSLTIRQVAISHNGKAEIKSTAKTRSSNREICIPQQVLDYLRPFRQREGYVYTRTGEVEAGDLYGARFRDFLKSVGLPHTRFHDLRHFAATTLMDAGVPDKIASSYLGHSSTNMTKKYQHIRANTERTAANVMDGIFNKNKGVKTGVS